MFNIQYLRDYLELENNKNISPHLLVEICSFPGSFEMTETIRGYQNRFSLQQKKNGSKNVHFFNLLKIYFEKYEKIWVF